MSAIHTYKDNKIKFDCQWKIMYNRAEMTLNMLYKDGKIEDLVKKPDELILEFVNNSGYSPLIIFSGEFVKEKKLDQKETKEEKISSTAKDGS